LEEAGGGKPAPGGEGRGQVGGRSGSGYRPKAFRQAVEFWYACRARVPNQAEIRLGSDPLSPPFRLPKWTNGSAR